MIKYGILMACNRLILLNPTEFCDYSTKEFGVGEYFWDSVVSDIESLIIYAGIHKKKFGLYKMFAKRFPYAIYYEVENDFAYVVAVLPMRRNPIWIAEQIGERR
jgi:hypothetical protein